MSTELLPDWNRRQVPVVRSRGSGVVALVNWTDALMRGQDAPWPPAAITQKLVRNDGLKHFDADAQAALTTKLGYYSALQSIHSEDAITWCFFGLLASASNEVRATCMNWVLERAGLPHADNQACEIDVWRRVPHPEGGGLGGPELDFLLTGDHCVVVGEAKWRSKEGRGQGRAKDKRQMQMRREFLDEYGRRIWEGRPLVLLGVSWQDPIEELRSADDAFPTAELRWSDLGECPAHPRAAEFARYLTWKAEHSQP